MFELPEGLATYKHAHPPIRLRFWDENKHKMLPIIFYAKGIEAHGQADNILHSQLARAEFCLSLAQSL